MLTLTSAVLILAAVAVNTGRRLRQAHLRANRIDAGLVTVNISRTTRRTPVPPLFYRAEVQAPQVVMFSHRRA